MRSIESSLITESVARLCIKSNIYIMPDILKMFKESIKKEEKPLAKEILGQLILNSQIAADEEIPICQDTGMAVVFLEIGQDVHITGNFIEDAVNEGISKGYRSGYLRKSIVKDPVDRINTGDNTPGIVHYKIVPGDKIKIIVSPKGFGSENMSRLAMLKPSDGIEGIKGFVLETVKIAGSNPCPPIVVGVGVGGTAEKSMLMAKEALIRPLGKKNPEPFWADTETEILEEINKTGIGPGGFGGVTTALAVHINTYPTHIAGMPVAVNIGCHVTRHEEEII